jgi:pSer/pThr/pTyr-binding forkhead associated (FHA) protein
MASDKSDSGASKPVPSQVLTTAARAHLECIAGPEKGQTLRVAPNITVIGRDATCDAIVTESVISRQHARIERRGDQWILKNLSSNGTILNRKPVSDEAVLADRDEIRLGTKTRLKFVVENVTLSSTGRPQFRRRVTAQEEAAAKAAEAETAGQEEAKPSLFQRRKGLFIGLGIYFVAMVVLVIGLTVSRGCGNNTGTGEIPVLGLDDFVHPAGNAPRMKIVGENSEGVIGEDALAKPVLVPWTDINAGKAWKIPGIRNAIDIKLPPQYDPEQVQTDIQQATELYRNKDSKGKRSNHFMAVRNFQKALAHNNGKTHFDDSNTDELYHKALEDLIKEVYEAYRGAIILDSRGDAKSAYLAYLDLLEFVPERTNIIYDNVSGRLALLKRNHPDLK